MIKGVEEMGGSKEYLRSITGSGEAEIPDWSPGVFADWPATPCKITTGPIGNANACKITANDANLTTTIVAFTSLVPSTNTAQLLIKPGEELLNQECGWFIGYMKEEQRFAIHFHVPWNLLNVIAVVTGQAPDVKDQVGLHKVIWT
jgi:hypothetical protein